MVCPRAEAINSDCSRLCKVSEPVAGLAVADLPTNSGLRPSDSSIKGAKKFHAPMFLGSS